MKKALLKLQVQKEEDEGRRKRSRQRATHHRDQVDTPMPREHLLEAVRSDVLVERRRRLVLPSAVERRRRLLDVDRHFARRELLRCSVRAGRYWTKTLKRSRKQQRALRGRSVEGKAEEDQLGLQPGQQKRRPRERPGGTVSRRASPELGKPLLNLGRATEGAVVEAEHQGRRGEGEAEEPDEQRRERALRPLGEGRLRLSSNRSSGSPQQGPALRERTTVRRARKVRAGPTSRGSSSSLSTGAVCSRIALFRTTQTDISTRIPPGNRLPVRGAGRRARRRPESSRARARAQLSRHCSSPARTCAGRTREGRERIDAGCE